MGGGVTPTKKTLAPSSLYLVGLTLFENAVPSRAGRWYVLVSTSSNGTAQLVRTGVNSSSGIWVLGSQPDQNTVSSPAVLSKLTSRAVGAFPNVVAALQELVTNHVSDRWRTMTEDDTSSTFVINGGYYLGQELSIVSHAVPVAGSLMAIQSSTDRSEYYLGCKMNDGSKRILRFRQDASQSPAIVTGYYNLQSGDVDFEFNPETLPLGGDTATPPDSVDFSWVNCLNISASVLDGVPIIDVTLVYENWTFEEGVDAGATYNIAIRDLDTNTDVQPAGELVQGDDSPLHVPLEEGAVPENVPLLDLSNSETVGCLGVRHDGVTYLVVDNYSASGEGYVYSDCEIDGSVWYRQRGLMDIDPDFQEHHVTSTQFYQWTGFNVSDADHRP